MERKPLFRGVPLPLHFTETLLLWTVALSLGKESPYPGGSPCPYILRKPRYYGQLLCPYGKKALTQGGPLPLHFTETSLLWTVALSLWKESPYPGGSPALTFYGNLIIIDSCFVPVERKPLHRGVPLPLHFL